MPQGSAAQMTEKGRTLTDGALHVQLHDRQRVQVRRRHRGREQRQRHGRMFPIRHPLGELVRHDGAQAGAE